MMTGGAGVLQCARFILAIHTHVGRQRNNGDSATGAVLVQEGVKRTDDDLKQ